MAAEDSSTKVCIACNEEKPISDFPPRGERRIGRCKPCRNEQARKYQSSPEWREYVLSWQRANKDKMAEYKKRYRSKPEARAKEAASYRKYYERHADRLRELGKVSAARWAKNNPEKRRAIEIARRIGRQRIPPWANADVIARIYMEAQSLTESSGQQYHVDHIVPLLSKVVCGLHNEFNLRIIPRRENHAKGNRYWPEMP